MAMRAAELGVPIIASDTPALKDQLGPEGAAYVTPKDAEALASALEAFLSQPDTAIKRAKLNQKHIFADHSWTRVGTDLKTIVEASL